jgi:hypothetical protein
MPACREGLLGNDNGHVCPVVPRPAEKVSEWKNLCACQNSDKPILPYNIIVICYSITVFFITLRMCEPNFVYYMCLFMTMLLCFSRLLFICDLTVYNYSVPSMCSALWKLVLPKSSLVHVVVCGGAVLSCGEYLSVLIKNRFLSVSKARRTRTVSRLLQQTTVLFCAKSPDTSFRAGKCWNLTGTGPSVWCIIYYV